ncbi:hypothetical protein HOLleu_33300 [Holothuria leucospilota]|uniref:Helix-turn-helix domain-containing protein n=1 Tax=Holothuria leucospilota TaxID=206669 RepID=A0A9Q0YNE0_HOLLE|nr:hypothetical protein HOLleu_33300 [Holothuria leucospilota]
MYLKYNSFRPKNTKHSIVCSQFLRVKLICSDPIDFDKQISQLTGFFLSAGNPLPITRKQINRARKRSSLELLQYQINLLTPNSHIPFVTSYHPPINRLIGILKHDFDFKGRQFSCHYFQPASPPNLSPPPISKRCLHLQLRIPADRGTEGGNTGCKNLDVIVRHGLYFIKVRNILKIKVPKLLRDDSFEIIPFFKYLGINQKWHCFYL